MNEPEAESAVWQPKLRRYQRRLLSLFLLALLAAVVFPGMECLRRIGRERVCRRELDFFSHMVICYHRSHDHLPPPYLTDNNGRPVHSWRILVLPYLSCGDESEGSRYNRYKFNEPWDSPDNTRFRNEDKRNQYSCPVYAKGSNSASYVCVVGSATMARAARIASRA